MNRLNILFSSFFILFSSYSLAEISCRDDESTESIDLLAKSIEGLGWFGATSKQTLNAPCTKSPPLNNNAIDKYFASKKSSIVSSENILGMSFENEDQHMLELFTDLVDPLHTTTSVFRRKVSILDINKVPQNCKKVMCAAEGIFGKDESKRLLYLLDKYGRNGSHLVFEHASPWKTKELDTALAAFDDLAPFQQKREANQEFYHFKRGYSRGSDLTIANAVIEIFDAWNDQSEGEKRYTLFHEVSHNLATLPGYYKLDFDPEWLAFSKWEKKGDTWTANNLDTIPSRYGATNPAEDFAESLSMYRYNPDAKKILGSEKYRFIKEAVFLGLEFNNENGCQPSKSFITKLIPSVEEANQSAISLSESEMSTCMSEFASFLTTSNYEYFNSCYYKKTFAKFSSKKLNELDLKYPSLVERRLGEVDLGEVKVGTAALMQFKQKFNSSFADALTKIDKDPVRRLNRIKDAFLKKSPSELCSTWSNDVGFDIYYSLQEDFKSIPDFNRVITKSDDLKNIAFKACLNLQNAKVAFTQKNFEHTMGLVLSGK